MRFFYMSLNGKFGSYNYTNNLWIGLRSISKLNYTCNGLL